MIQKTQQTLARIALENTAVIPVLEKYDLDFCCQGKRTLEEACIGKNINPATVIAEMEQATAAASTDRSYTSMDAGQLISHILLHHHFYVRQSIPAILNHLEKLVAKHGDRYPQLAKVKGLFEAVRDELVPHMQKEELILFPRILEIAAQSGEHKNAGFPAGYLEAPVEMMENEHVKAGDLCSRIRQATGNYTPPPDACTTHRVCLEELKFFEEDLHRHVHLENNVLFPMALAMVHAGQPLAK